ncbi:MULTISPECIES: hypothetical protein [Bacteroidaceae]|uniref:Uncharacterized protein n=1 Tax=Caecibacteroides pullorum TaxID=2725562 RepID=A0AA41D9G5_9BACT|nr:MULTISPECIES: hypothetical protein [Bacteroidaceae]MBM6857731.1 hypothetical protein [Caecibacteroides pullorum]MBV8058851.1 hypothetical protein [Caecibacteroides pullorum]
MKEEDKLLKKIGTENPFRVPEGYFEGFTSDLMSRLPEKEKTDIHREPTTWERVRPWLYMAAMFIGAALIIRVASPGETVSNGQQQQQIAADESDIEMEYIRTAIENTMMDDYSLYVYLSDENAE